MRFSSVTILAALSSLALAQNLLDQIPQCARDCFGNNLGTCNALDIKCVCANSTLIGNISCCVSKQCSPSDQEATIKFAVDLCGAQGVSVPTSAACTNSPSATPTSGAASGSSAASGSASGSTTPTATGASSAASGVASGAASATAAGSTGAAPIHTGIGMGVAMAGLLAAL